ncbi:MAG: gamma carbonic anhydrase family protein [Sulfuriflexus sp.]|nr:gamma carbonic anhydrase family protein [Sulfuriflexus sp.]MDT8405163.1 gamma carbonic anhydrase family protein [Sulfuriflexus sp.]
MTIRDFEKHRPQIAASAFIDETAVVIGDVEIGDDVSVWPTSVVRGDVNSIRIGAKTNIQDGSVLHVTHDSEHAPGGYPLHIGEGVTVGHRVILHACTIGDYCLVGMGATVLDGAILEDKVMLGANSLVSPGKVLEGGNLYLGSPARKVRRLRDSELAWLEYSAAHYVVLKNRYQAG